MDRKLKVGIVGLGGILNNAHVIGYHMLRDKVEIAAVCDIVPEKIESFKTRFGYQNIPGFTDYKELLKVEGLDFIDICTPNYLHSIIAVDALNAGLHVFCEKPDAVSVEEAERMREAAERNNRHLMVMRNNRHREAAKYLKQYITDGNMGDIYCGRCGWQRRRGIPGKGGWFTTKAQSGGGPLIDLGVHMIDLAVWLMGNPTPVSVSGCTYTKFASSDISDSVHSQFGEKVTDGTFDVEDLAMGFVRFDNGSCLQIEFSWASNIEEERTFVELRGDKAGFEFKNGALKIFTEADGKLVDLEPMPVNGNWGHEYNMVHFVDVLMGDAEPDFTPTQGVNMIKILEAIYESAQTGKEVRL